jgi:hypothetical protein
MAHVILGPPWNFPVDTHNITLSEFNKTFYFYTEN